MNSILSRLDDEELRRLLTQVRDRVRAGDTPEQFASHLGLERGVTGYMYHTVPASLFCFLRHPGDFRAAVEAVIRLGGDADSTAALVGSLAGAQGGVAAIPQEWLNRLLLWPRTATWLHKVAERLATTLHDGAPSSAVPVFWPGLAVRNAVFNATVFAHVLRRLLPPY